MRYIGAGILIAVTIAAAPAGADMYKWTDRSGVVHFSDQAGDRSAEKVDQERLTVVTETADPSSDAVPERSSLPGEITVRGRLLFDGKPLAESTAAPAVFRLYSQTLRQWITPEAEYEATTGAFLLKRVPEGTYSCDIKVNADARKPQYPGDYRGTVSFNASSAKRAEISVDMERLLHLTRPEDNAVQQPEWGAVCMNRIEYPTPVRLSWDSLGRDVSYTYMIVRTECSPFAFKETVAGDTITSPGAVLDLPPSREGEFYTLRIQARKGNRPVGSLMTHGKNGWGWDYRFRVVPKRRPIVIISPAGK
ncbi:MAG: hypothetical protein A2010_13870 [Nitrospirae bacterium GWD2_57_9]|nr:MAG: hypothetical protein A2010_13870 [Nitrospirae bacterium GWD2_57_9]